MTATESKLKKALVRLPEMQYAVDHRGILKYIKFAKGNMEGFDPSDFAGKTITSFLPPHVSELISAKVREVFESGCGKTCNYSLDLPEVSTPMHFEASLNLMDEKEVLVSVRDVTSQVVAERKLVESESLYRKLFEGNPVPMCIYDKDSLVILDANAAMSECYGYSRDEFSSMTIGGIKILEGEKGSDRDAAKGKAPLSYQRRERHRIKDGTALDVEVTSTVIPTGDGEACLLVCSDVTEKVLIGRTLEEREEQYRHLFELSPLPMLVLDIKTYRYLDVNEAAVKHYGYSREEFLRMTARDIRPPGDVKKTIKSINDTHPEQTSVGIWRHKKKDGSIILVDIYTFLTQYEGKEARIALINDVTERMAAQRDLAESEEKFRTAFYTSPDAIAISRLEDGVLLEVNQGFLDLTGYARDEVIGKSTIDLHIWPDNKERDKSIQKYQVDGKIKELELLLKMKDKSIRDVLVSTGTIQLEGRPHLLTVTRDVTDIKRAQHALEVSEDKFRTAFMISPDAISISRLKDGRYVDVNESFLRLSGYKREEVIGKTSFDINIWIDPDDRKRLVGAMKEKGYVENLEMQYRMKDGSHLDTLTSAKIMDLGGVPHFISITRDFTQIKKAQDALKESEERFRAAFDASPDAIVLIDMETRKISHVNNCFITRSGFTKEEVLGKTTEELKVWENPEGRDEFYTILKNKGAVDGFESNFRLKNGSISKTLISAQPLEWMGRLHILVTIRNISSIVETRNRLLISLAEKEVLLKEVHHRVKNNLQVISGLLNLQAHHMADEKGRMSYKESQNRVQTMALIHEELYQSRDLSQVDFREYLDRLCKNIFSSYGVSTERIRCDLDIQEKEVIVDTAIPCGLIVNELVSNSLKHAFPNGRDGVIRISFERVGPQMFQLKVSDNGIGMPKDIDIYKSISLGLQLVSVLVEQLGGRLEVDSEEGAVFRMTLKEHHEAGTTLY